MNGHDWIQVLLALVSLTLLAPPLGVWMAGAFDDERPAGRLEKWTYRIAGVDPNDEMTWRQYAVALLVFNIIGLGALFLLQELQSALPLNPQAFPPVPWHLALNTAISFVTNTNWQAYSGENTMSYLTQMLGLGVQNFVSAATGFAALLALIRGLKRRESKTLGNFWVDVTRATLHVLLPLSFVFALILASQGVVQNFRAAEVVRTVEGREQVIPQGPAASQIAIKQLGTNGGGYFNANSAHPLENPTPITGFLSLLALLLLPAALTHTFGRMVGNRRQGWVLFTAMLLLLVAGLAVSLYSEYPGGSMEGKETRFGITNSVLWSTFTTAASNGSVNAMHSSLSPLTGGVAMLNMMLGEIIFGGVGCGLYGMLLFVLLTVFLAGLMVGRTPEYLGKKIEAREIQLTLVGVLAPSACILVGAAVTLATPAGLVGITSKGPHGFSEVLYAFTSASGNNGSAFGGLSANTVYYNLILGLAMLIGRFGILVPVLAIAGGMGAKKIAPPSVGTFTTDNWLFIVLLLAVIVIVGALTFLPALALGPIVEHILWLNGKTF